MDEGRDYIYVYQNELHQLYFQKIVEQLDNLQLGNFKFKTNICLNEIRSDEKAKVTTSATIEHATFTGNNNPGSNPARQVDIKAQNYFSQKWN